MRSTLSPAFTGSKMRNMFLLVSEIGEQMTNYYLNMANDSENKSKFCLSPIYKNNIKLMMSLLII